MKKVLLIALISMAAGTFSCSKDDPVDETFYTVSFDADGGRPTPSSQQVKGGDMAVAPATNPARTGYIFLFWRLSGASTAYDFRTPVNGDVALAAKWQEEAAVEYWQVTWNLNGGAWPSGDNHATQVAKGGTLAEPAAPAKSGSAFDGWYKEAGLTNRVDFPYDVSAAANDFTLYAGWTAEGGGEEAGTFNSIAALSAWLKSQPENTKETVYKVKLEKVNLDSGNNWNDLGIAVKGSNFADLNLQGCTGAAIPDGRTEAGRKDGVFYVNYYGAFVNCDNLLAIILPDGLKTIGKYTFVMSDNLASVTLPANLETIGANAFFSCDALATVALPEGLKTIGGEAFSQSGLTSVTIPGSVTDFGAGAFMRCESLTTVTVEDGVKAIGADAFWRCSALAELIMLPVVPPTLKVNTDGLKPLEDTPASLKIKTPAASLNAYKTAAGWSAYASRIVANTN